MEKMKGANKNISYDSKKRSDNNNGIRNIINTNVFSSLNKTSFPSAPNLNQLEKEEKEFKDGKTELRQEIPHRFYPNQKNSKNKNVISQNINYQKICLNIPQKRNDNAKLTRPRISTSDRNCDIINRTSNVYSTKKKSYDKCINNELISPLIRTMNRSNIKQRNTNNYENNISNSGRLYTNMNNYSENYNNNILLAQNKEYKIKIAEMRYKINELLNNLRLVASDKQVLINEKKYLLAKLSSLNKEIITNIEKAKDEINRLNLLLGNEKKIDNTSSKEIPYEEQLYNQYNKTEIKGLDESVNEENLNNKNFPEFQKQIKFLKNKIKNLEKNNKNLSYLENQKNSYERKIKDFQKYINDLNKQILVLQKENNNLKNNFNGPDNNNQKDSHNKYLEQIKQLVEENNKLKNKIKSLEKNNNNENRNNKGEDLQMVIQKLNNKISNLEKENLNKQYQIYELKNLNNKLKIRVNSVNSGNFKLSKGTTKELENKIQMLQQKNEELQEQLAYLEKNGGANITKLFEEKQKLSEDNLDLKNELLILKNQIKEKENEDDFNYNLNEKNNFEDEMREKNKTINDLVEKNENLMKENKELNEKIRTMKNGRGNGLPPQEPFSEILENLKEELKDKNLQIEKLIEENNNLKLKNNIGEGDDKKNTRNTANTFNSLGFTDEEKMKKFLEEIKQLKVINESDMIQIKTLKADIKELKEKLVQMTTFSGQLKNYDEFIFLLNKTFESYRPKTKEQKEAFNRLINVMNNHRV